jgi:hypothetical protein
LKASVFVQFQYAFQAVRYSGPFAFSRSRTAGSGTVPGLGWPTPQPRPPAAHQEMTADTS